MRAGGHEQSGGRDHRRAGDHGFLALESTGSLPLTLAVLATCVISAQTVRRTFGYLRHVALPPAWEAIRSAVDIGWMRSLTVGRMMRRETRTVRAETPIAAFKRDFPLGAAAGSSD